MANATLPKPRRFSLRRQAAPLIELNIDPDQVDELQAMIAEFPDLREILATDRHPDGVDGQYGPNTLKAIKRIAFEANISIDDISKIDFRNKSGELYQRFTLALREHHKEGENLLRLFNDLK